MRRLALPLLLLTACGSAAARIDAAGDGALGDAIRDAPPDAPVDASTIDAAVACPGARPVVATIGGAWGVAIADDGTIFATQPGAIARLAPGAGAPELAWATLPGAPTVRGLALGRTALYAGAEGGGGAIFAITATTPPTVTTVLANAGAPRGLAVAGDESIYYADPVDRAVYRVAGGTRTTVTSQPLPAASGVFLRDASHLVVTRADSGVIVELTLDATGRETARATRATVPGAGFVAVTRDRGGRWLLSDGITGRVDLLGADFAAPSAIAINLAAPAGLAFGRGPLRCTDLYVATGGAMRVIPVP
jgi:hypothetical protein